ncbi:MAG: hypothetical protein C3F12_03365 [Candidatus Methylomirabilota bacterium]|nr:helix-turn-helix domain-containing protein [candidate division NC10 bacterium]PWB47738.1 MAG: hypothetical protein C3F12_03365 [candidate division NC10 bacterium]
MWGPLTATERRARKALLELILRTGRDPGLKALALRLEVSESVADELLSTLERKGLAVRDQRSNQITAAYPLSTRPTQHQIMLKDKGKPRYAVCAIDALSVAPLFGAAVTVNTTCQQCGRSIRIYVERNRIAAVQPPGTVVWDGLPGLLMKRAPHLDLAVAH